MKYLNLGLSFIVATVVVAGAWADFPFGAADTTYGLRSRIAENPSHRYFPSPEDWRDINMYQLFTDRFADGDSGNNTTGALGINRSGWYVEGKSFPENRNYHHGGDWKGLKDNLNYLSGMGVKAIWMSGVQMNAQGRDNRYTPYHMYHPTDFFKVDPAMGTFQELKDLIDACHARGIYVILDVVINHTSDLNGLRNGSDDKWYWPNGGPNFGWWDESRKHAPPFDNTQFFHGNGTINNWDSFPEFIYGQFKGTDDLATGRDDVKGWLEQAFKNLIDATDCDGFRVDAIKHVDEGWIKYWADQIRKHAAFRGKNDFILFGEYFTYDNFTLAKYCKDPGYSFNSALFFPMSQTFKSVFVDGAGSGQLTSQLNNRFQYGEGGDRLVTFIDNHDVNRIGLQAGGDPGHIVWVMRPALTFLYTGTPVPCLFYGTEQAFQQGGHWNGSSGGADYDDADWQRECMFNRGFQPGPANGNKLVETNAPLYQHIAALNRARNTYKSLTRGSYQQRWDSSGRGPFAYSRVYQSEEALVALNTADGNVSLSPSVGKPNGTEFVNVLNPTERITVSGGQLSINLSGKESKIFIAGLAAQSTWVRGTYSYPPAGQVDPTTIVYINTEAGPTGAVASVKAIYTTNNWVTSSNAILAANTEWASQGGMWYGASLGAFSAGAAIKFFIEVTDVQTNKVYDNNGQQDFLVNVGQPPGVWSRGTKSYPVDGDVTDADELFVDTEVGPTNLVQSVRLLYSTNGVTTMSVVMNVNTNWGSDGGRWYNYNLGRFPAGTVLRYAIETSGSTSTNLDNNGGSFYQVTVRAAVNPGSVRMVQHAPVITDGGAPDNPGDAFDFNTTGGALVTRGDAGFGSFGNVYVNFDSNHLYIGASDVALPDDSVNNAYVIFVSGGTNPGTENLWGFNGLPGGIDQLHNVAFQPTVNFAILLGDVYGDGIGFTNFNMYKSDGFDFGQGIFSCPSGGSAFAPVAGAKLSQFGGYGPDNRLAANWESAIPLSAFGVSNAHSLTNLHLSGLMVTRSTSNNNRYISGKYLGQNATLGNDELADAVGNFAFSFVNLTGLSVLPPRVNLDVPDNWVLENLPPGWIVTAASDFDNDTIPDRVEFFAGLNPMIPDELEITDMNPGTMRLYKSGNQAVNYTIGYAHSVVNGGWAWSELPVVTSLDGQVNVPVLTLSNAVMRVRINVPAMPE
jgi:glycosidase